jgi:DNA replicative helicase MCM subunit Mcm2 (Cdc46/Mcm family)
VAKISLSEQVTDKHIEEAHRLFQNSTIRAINAGDAIVSQISTDMQKIVLRVEETIKRRITINGIMRRETLEQ